MSTGCPATGTPRPHHTCRCRETVEGHSGFHRCECGCGWRLPGADR